ncbi:MAG: prepilin-type N-terminal cleavage/methylation domain-containing protein [Planctomycetota bacterium]|nr:prepilin-type N-terminal cleavage/methylation domain-containing protein [Planctomycetota bacterium]
MTLTIGPSDETRSDGFTLLELIAVLVLISTMLAMAAPSLRGFVGGRQTAEAAAQLLSLTKLARSRAAAQGCVYRLNIDTEEKTYWLTRQRAGAFVAIENESGRRFQFPDGMSVRLELPSQDNTVSYIQFYPNGRTDEARIELTGQQGEVFEVTCPSATERFRVVSPSQADEL